MRVLIIGATGLVGHSLWRLWRTGDKPWEVTGTYRNRPHPGMEALDVRDPSALRRTLARARPEAVVLAASNPYVDYCETHSDETRRINVEAAVDAAHAVREAGAKLVFFSSDYVFDGSRAPYGEEDPVRPINEYGRQKAEAERALASALPDHLIARISGVYGWELSRKNFVLQLLDRPPGREPVLAARDVRYKPTYAPNLAGVLRELLEQGARGTFHAAGDMEISRYEFAQAVVRTFGLDPKLVSPVEKAQVPSPTQRPSNSTLKTDKLRAIVRSPLWGPVEGLGHMLRTASDWREYLSSLTAPAGG